MVIFSIGIFFTKTALEKDKITIEKGSYIEVDLSKEYKEKGKNLPEFLKGQETNFFSMLKTFDYIERDKDIKGVVLKLDNLSLSSAQIEELGKKLDSLKKSKKEVYSYMTMADNKNYSLIMVMNAQGEKVIYQYEATENTLQLYHQVKQKQPKQQKNIMTYVFAATTVVFALISLVLIRYFYIHKKH